MSSVLSPARGMLTKQKNIISEQIKKCSIKEEDFNEKDIGLLKEMKNILDDTSINDLEKKIILKCLLIIINYYC